MHLTSWRIGLALALLTLSCSCAGSQPVDTKTEAVPTQITCPPGPSVDADYDVFTGPRSKDTPTQIGVRYADPDKGEKAVIAFRKGTSATVMIMREDGTAHTKLGLDYTSFAGWHVETAAACSSRSLRPAARVD